MEIQELSVTEAHEILKQDPKTKLIDVRTDEEFAHARIPGSVLINNKESMEKEILSLPTDTRLIVHCHHGGRSYQAAAWLAKKGFTNVFNLAGGIDAWSQEIDKKIPRY